MLGFNLTLPSSELGDRRLLSANQPDDGLLSLLGGSPYKSLLSRTSWVEFPRCHPFPEEWNNIMCGCWVKKPRLNYATAVLFAGCVLYNPLNRNAVLCMVAESYGRGVDVDVHCEKPKSIGQGVSGISQPSSSGLYPHATVCHIQHDKNDHRLVVGCKIFNILFTEVWQLDRDCSSERAVTAGCCSSVFPIVGSEDIRIFIDKQSLDLASKIVSGEHIPPYETSNLRQIRSHLCSAHSYRMGRASSPLIANMVSAQAATIFTIAMINPGLGDTSFVSSLLSRIAKEVDAEGRQAVLRKDLVLDILDEVKPGLFLTIVFSIY